MRFELRLANECPVCKQNIDDERVSELAVVADLFGRMAYSVCVCGQEPPDMNDTGYRQRVDAWVEAQRKRRESRKP